MKTSPRLDCQVTSMDRPKWRCLVSESPNSTSDGDPDVSPRRLILATLVVTATTLAFVGVYLLWAVLLCVFIGIVLDTALKPFTDFVSRYVPRTAAVALVYILAVGILGALVSFAIPAVLVQTESLLARLPEIYQQLREPWLASSHPRIARIAARLPESVPALTLADLNLTGSLDPSGGMNIFVYFLRASLTLAAVVLSAFYWALQGQRTAAALLLWVPDPRRESARQLVDEMQQKVGAFIRGQGILCLFVGGICLVGFWLIGLPYPLVLAALAGAMEIVPYFGPTLAAIPAILVAISTDPALLIWVLVVIGVVQFIENNLLVPRIMDQSVGVHPVVTILALAGFGSLMGVAGVVLAIPLAAIVQLLLQRFVLQKDALETTPLVGRDRASRLRYEAHQLMQDVRSQLRQKRDAPTENADWAEDAIEALAAELERDLAEVESPPAAASPAEVAL
jgi:predicted PurR-regulated permease PerM